MDYGAEQTTEQQTVIPREEPQVEPARKALVERWCKTVRAGEQYEPTKKAFERMRQDMEYAWLGAKKDWVEGDNYVVPIIQRHINQAVAQLYAKNPRGKAKRRERLWYTVWDGDPQALQAAMLNPADPNALALLMDVQQAKLQMQMLDRTARTLEIVFHHYLGEQATNFKQQFKQMVRRTKVCGVGYIEIGYQRTMQRNPDVTAQISDATEQIDAIERMMADAADGELQPDAPDLEELKLALRDLQEQETILLREGLTFGFPRSTEIIVDPRCRQIKGFIGAGWIARKMLLSVDEVKEIYGVDLGKGFTPYHPDKRDRMLDIPEAATAGGETPAGMACVWKIWNKKTNQALTVADGYCDFLQEPRTPEVEVEGFWPVFVNAYNDIEHETEMFPPSDVWILRHPQDEYNRSRQGLREHRRANRPKYGTPRGALDDQDKTNLQSHPDSAIIELNGLQVGQKVSDLLQRFDTVPIDPTLYDTTAPMEDVLRSVGAQEANIGGTSGASATETSIAESSRISSVSSNVDDLDELLTQVARASGQILLMNLAPETAKKIAGPGAVWPELSREEVAEEIQLEIKAGSSGRPNQAAELANLERGMPFILQLPGVNPMPLAKRYFTLLDLDVEEIYAEGLPSIIAMNSMAGKTAQVATGDPATDPVQQGGQGGANAPRGRQEEPGAQPAYPTVGDQMGIPPA